MKTSIYLLSIHAKTGRLGGNLGENPNPKTSTKTEALKNPTEVSWICLFDAWKKSNPCSLKWW